MMIMMIMMMVLSGFAISCWSYNVAISSVFPSLLLPPG